MRFAALIARCGRGSGIVASFLCGGCLAHPQGPFALSVRGVAAFGNREDTQTTSSVTSADTDVSAAGAGEGASSPAYNGAGYVGGNIDVRGRAIGLETALQLPAIDVVGGIDWNSINDHGVRDLMIGLRKRWGNETAQGYFLFLARHSLDHYDDDAVFNGLETGIGVQIIVYDWAFFDVRWTWSRTTDLIIESERITLQELKLQFGFGVAW
jgi:hypothetical protein